VPVTPTLPKYVTKFDNMKARKRWYDRTRTVKLDHIAADIVEGIREQEVVGGQRESFWPFAELLAWIPEVYVLQQQRVHDIVGLTRDAGGALWVTCSCGVTAAAPDDIASKYRIPVVFLCTHGHRDRNEDANAETWFYAQPGHRDPFYGDVTRCFVGLFADQPNGGPRRQLVCTVCQRELEFRYSGKLALFRPETYARAVDDHLAQCAGHNRTEPISQ
jgi:hypothetical protein